MSFQRTGLCTLDVLMRCRWGVLEVTGPLHHGRNRQDVWSGIDRRMLLADVSPHHLTSIATYIFTVVSDCTGSPTCRHLFMFAAILEIRFGISWPSSGCGRCRSVGAVRVLQYLAHGHDTPTPQDVGYHACRCLHLYDVLVSDHKLRQP